MLDFKAFLQGKDNPKVTLRFRLPRPSPKNIETRHGNHGQHSENGDHHHQLK